MLAAFGPASDVPMSGSLLAGGALEMLPLMPALPGTFAEDVVNQPARAQFEAFLDEHRGQLNRCLDGLTEDQAR